jgi:hypothetical protein
MEERDGGLGFGEYRSGTGFCLQQYATAFA